jgi:hypothetical protein
VGCLHWIAKNRLDVTGGMQHAENLDSAFDGPVEDQIVLESLDLLDAEAGKLASPKLLPLAKLRHGGQPLKTRIRCLKEANCGFAISLCYV